MDRRLVCCAKGPGAPSALARATHGGRALARTRHLRSWAWGHGDSTAGRFQLKRGIHTCHLAPCGSRMRGSVERAMRGNALRWAARWRCYGGNVAFAAGVSARRAGSWRAVRKCNVRGRADTGHTRQPHVGTRHSHPMRLRTSRWRAVRKGKGGGVGARTARGGDAGWSLGPGRQVCARRAARVSAGARGRPVRPACDCCAGLPRGFRRGRRAWCARRRARRRSDG